VVSTGRRLSLVLACLLSISWFILLTHLGRAGEPPELEKLGETAGIREFALAVTAIQQNAACADAYRPLKPGQQFLRFDLEVSSTVDRFTDPRTANDVRLRHWAVEGSDGAMEKDLYMYTKCGDGTEAIAQPILPGTHTKTVVVINAPKPATFLELDIPRHQVWRFRWPIPAAGG
jgi:hypothetical protein